MTVTDKQYQIERAMVQLAKIGNSIVNENVTTWARLYKKKPHVTKTMNITRYGEEIEALFDNYYSSYFLETLQLREEVMNG